MVIATKTDPLDEPNWWCRRPLSCRTAVGTRHIPPSPETWVMLSDALSADLLDLNPQAVLETWRHPRDIAMRSMTSMTSPKIPCLNVFTWILLRLEDANRNVSSWTPKPHKVRDGGSTFGLCLSRKKRSVPNKWCLSRKKRSVPNKWYP